MQIHLAQASVYKPPGSAGFLRALLRLFTIVINLIYYKLHNEYRHIPGDKKALANLDLEARILQAIGPHRHVIGFMGD